MALLLAMYQKFKLTREKNTLSYKLARHSSKLDRLQNNISKKQKYYEGLMKKIQKKATDYKNMFNMGIRNQFGMGTSVFDPTGGNAFANGAIAGIMYKALTSGQTRVWDYNSEGQANTGTDGNNSQTTISAVDAARAQQISAALVGTAGGQGFALDENGNYVHQNYQGLQLTKEEWAEYGQVYQMSCQQNTMNQQYANAAMQQYEANISIWQEAWEAQIEAEQESVLGAMEYEESMMELDKVNMETRLERIKSELESYTSLLSEEAKNTTPKFGL